MDHMNISTKIVYLQGVRENNKNIAERERAEHGCAVFSNGISYYYYYYYTVHIASQINSISTNIFSMYTKIKFNI